MKKKVINKVYEVCIINLCEQHPTGLLKKIKKKYIFRFTF